MTDTAAPSAPTETLPAVPLADLPEATKDYLISQHAATGRPIADLVREILNRASRQTQP